RPSRSCPRDPAFYIRSALLNVRRIGAPTGRQLSYFSVIFAATAPVAAPAAAPITVPLVFFFISWPMSAPTAAPPATFFASELPLIRTRSRSPLDETSPLTG